MAAPFVKGEDAARMARRVVVRGSTPHLCMRGPRMLLFRVCAS
jgi:hypothetical protein